MNDKPKEEIIKKDAPVQQKKNRAPVYIIVIALLLLTLIFFYNQTRQLKEQKQQQQVELTQKIDSVAQELDLRIEEIKALGGSIDTLEAIKTQLLAEKKQLLVDADYQKGRIRKLNTRLDGYKELLLIKDEEIKQLKVLNEELSEENTSLKVEKNQLNESILSLQENAQKMEAKIQQASRLEVEGVYTVAINDKGKERTGDAYRNRHIAQLKIEFTVLENEIAPIEGKELLIRVVAPDGNVLFDVTKGSGSFTLEGRELFYTAKQEILYDRSSQTVSLLYDKGSDYAIGEHIIEIYTDEYPMGTGKFTIK